MIDLSKLPAPQIIETLPIETIKGQIKSDYTKLMRVSYPDYELFDTDPIAGLIEVVAYREYHFRQKAANDLSQVFLAFSEGEALQNIVAERNIVKLPGESSEDLKKRYLQAFDGLSTAGPEGAYRYWVGKVPGLTNLSDVKIYPQINQAGLPTGVLRVVCLFLEQKTGTPFSFEERLDAIKRFLESEDIKPLTERIEVVLSKPTEPFKIRARAFIPDGIDPDVVVQNSLQNLTRYINSRFRVGSIFPRSGIISAIHAAITPRGYDSPNVVNVIVDEPSTDVRPGIEEFAKIATKEVDGNLIDDIAIEVFVGKEGPDDI